MNKNPRCATHAFAELFAKYTMPANPYDDPAYQVPTCQREKIIPDTLKKQMRCATPAMDHIWKLEAEYERRIAAGETEANIVNSWKK